jgi:hypothetical protein
MARWPEHHAVPVGLPEPGMRGAIVDADVGLDLDDPADASTSGVIADQARADERPGRQQGRARQQGPLEDAQPPG